MTKGFLSETQVLERFMDGGNDPRFLALVGAGWKFFAGSSGWVFPFRQNEEVTLIGAEPMSPPRTKQAAQEEDDGILVSPEGKAGLARLAADFAEFCEAAHPELVVFAAISRPVALVLNRAGLKKLRTGTDTRTLLPLEALSAPFSAPMSADGEGQGRRREDVQFEEWDPAELDPGTPKRAALEAFYRARSGENLAAGRERFIPPGLLEPEGVLALLGMKRYFVLHQGGSPIGLCVAVPVPGRAACWIRDFLLERGLSREAARKLLDGVLHALKESGVEYFWVPAGCALTPGETQSAIGEKLYLAYKAQPGSGLWAHQAFRIALHAVLEAAPPRFRLSVGRTAGKGFRFALHWPTTLGAALCVLLPFIMINHLGDFPAWALERAGVARGGPLSLAWWGRSILGQFLLPDRRALVTLALPLLACVGWLERRRGSLETPLALLVAACVSPVVAQVFFLLPLRLVHPELFAAAGSLSSGSIGGEWMLSMLLGFAFGTEAKRLRSAAASAWLLTAAVWIGVLLACVGSRDSELAALVLVPLFSTAFGVGTSFTIQGAALKSTPGSLTLGETKTDVCQPGAGQDGRSDGGKPPKDGSQTLCTSDSTDADNAPARKKTRAAHRAG